MSENYLQKNFTEYQRKAAQGDMIAQYELGLCYEKGKGTMEDINNAVYWYKMSAKNGYAKAQCTLGFCYEKGKGVPKNIVSAFNWYEKSANQGNATGQYNLALLYEKGGEVKQDYKKAIDLYERAATQNHASSQYNLAILYYNGKAVQQDFLKAVKLFEKAASQGHAKAQNMLGICYEKGKGVELNLVLAREWYKKSAEKGNSNAKANFERLDAVTADIKRKERERTKSLTTKLAISIIWGVISIAFLTYCFITDFKFFVQLQTNRKDFVNYVLLGVLHVVGLLGSIIGAFQLLFIPEAIKKKTKALTYVKLICSLAILIIATVICFLGQNDNGKMATLIFVEVLAFVLLYLYLGFFKESNGQWMDNWKTMLFVLLVITIAVEVLTFLLCSWLKHVGQGFLSFVAGFICVVVVLVQIISLIYEILALLGVVHINTAEDYEKMIAQDRKNKADNKEKEYNPTNTEKVKQSEKKEIDKKYYHYKTKLESYPGNIVKAAIVGEEQEYTIEATFYFKNAEGKEKTKTGTWVVTDRPGLAYVPITISQAEEHFKYMLSPIGDGFFD